MEALEALDGTTLGYGAVVSAGAVASADGDGTILGDLIDGTIGAMVASAGVVVLDGTIGVMVASVVAGD